MKQYLPRLRNAKSSAGTSPDSDLDRGRSHPKMRPCGRPKRTAPFRTRSAEHTASPCANRLRVLALCRAVGHLETDAARLGRRPPVHEPLRTNLPNYVNNLRALGYSMRLPKRMQRSACGRDRRLGHGRQYCERIQAHLAAELRTCVSMALARPPGIVIADLRRSEALAPALIAGRAEAWTGGHRHACRCSAPAPRFHPVRPRNRRRNVRQR